MTEETGTSGYEERRTEETETVRRSREEETETVTISGTGKRRRYDYELHYKSRHDDDVDLQQNVVSSTESVASDHHVDSLFICSVNDDSISDLKAECVSSNDGFSRETSTSSIVCFESEEMDSLSTLTVNNNNNNNSNNNNNNNNNNNKKKKKMMTSAAVMMPSAAELEEFFSKAEKYEQKRFSEKYNYDTVKDVPMEGRYQWVPLKP